MVLDHNDIYDNGAYELQVTQDANSYSADFSSAVVTATDNWWGTTDPVEIASKVYDHNDDVLLPMVDYLPLLDGSITGTPSSLAQSSYLQGQISENTTLSASESPYTLLSHVYSAKHQDLDD